MKIGIVNQWFPPEYGGIASYNAYVARGYSELGHEVTVLTARTSPDQPRISMTGGIRVIRIDHWIEPYRLRRLPVVGRHVRTVRHVFYSLQVQRVLSGLVRTHALDIVEFAEINAEGIMHVLRPSGVPTVVRSHTPHVLLNQTVTEDRGFDMGLIARIESAFVKRAEAVTAPSAHLARAVEREMRLPPHTVHVIPNPIDTEEFSPGPPRSSLCEPVTILYVGRLGREKGIFVLAEALALLATGGTQAPWRAVIAGADRPDAAGHSNRAQLDDFFSKRGLSGRVELCGSVSQEHLVALYRSADVCVVPSIFYESFSYTSVQALACGKPVVASSVGGIPEVVIDGETGFVIPPGDAQALAEALRRLVDDGSLRAALGEAGRRRAVERYAYPIIAGANLQLFADILSDSTFLAGPIRRF
jgi:glycosyltransferase involved in cell wall biosynthesis